MRGRGVQWAECSMLLAEACRRPCLPPHVSHTRCPLPCPSLGAGPCAGAAPAAGAVGPLRCKAGVTPGAAAGSAVGPLCRHWRAPEAHAVGCPANAPLQRQAQSGAALSCSILRRRSWRHSACPGCSTSTGGRALSNSRWPDAAVPRGADISHQTAAVAAAPAVATRPAPFRLCIPLYHLLVPSA